MRRLYWLVAVLAVAACDAGPTPTALDEPDTPSPSVDVVPQTGAHIVVFNDVVADSDGLTSTLIGQTGGELLHTYSAALKGFAAHLSPAAVEALRNHPAVAFVEPDGIVSIVDNQPNPPSWGLDRIDQTNLPLNSDYSYANTGAGVTVYILDTGIWQTHQEFAGRASGGFTAIADGNGTNDCNGHGTHVAGTVGGTTTGVAKDVNLVAVRVLGCGGSGSTSGVIAGIDWVTANAVAPAVANMSLGGGFSTALNNAVAASIASGVTYALSAGNDNFNACLFSPGSTPPALTVGSTTITDARSGFSNFGTCVDIFAPGSGIFSSYAFADNNYATLSGTSMASPHVAGAAARYLEANPGSTPAQVGAGLIAAATPGVVTNPGAGSPNLLLFAPPMTGPPPPNDPPVASFTSSCVGLTCTLDGTGSTDDVGIVSYDWQTGDPAQPTASGAVVTITYPASGPRTVTLTVTDGPGLTDSQTQTVNVPEPPPFTGFRINAQGGNLIDSNGDLFVADQPFSTGSFGFVGGGTGNFPTPVAGTTDDVLYQGMRGGPSFSYLFDGLAPGDYDVTLFFTEPWWTNAGQRLIDIQAEGVLVLDNLDLVAASGGSFVAHQETFTATVSDGTLNVDFIAALDNAIVSAIAVVEAAPPVPEPNIVTTPGSLAFGNVETGSSADLVTTITNTGTADLTVTGLATTNVDFSVVSPATPFTVAPGAPGVDVTVRFAPASVGAASGDLNVSSNDPDEPVATVPLSGTGVEPPSFGPFRMNSDGPDFTDSNGDFFEADRPFAAGSFGFVGGGSQAFPGEVAGTTDDVLYQGLHGGTSFSYVFDGIASGDYNVTLYFMEPFWTSAGQRVMDVTAEGALALDNFDIVAASGGSFVAHQETFLVTVTDGTLDVDFSAVVNIPVVSAIAVEEALPPS